MVKLKWLPICKDKETQEVKSFTKGVTSEWYQIVPQVTGKSWLRRGHYLMKKRVICDLWKRNFKVVVGTDKQLQVIAEWLHTTCTHSFAELLVILPGQEIIALVGLLGMPWPVVHRDLLINLSGKHLIEIKEASWPLHCMAMQWRISFWT